MRVTKAARTRAKRGRPPKFGRPGRVVAVTLPEEIVRGLKRVNADLAWAIVGLYQQRARRVVHDGAAAGDAELIPLTRGRSVIVVKRDVFKELPGINLIPLDGDRALLALDHDAGLADLELAVVDRMAKLSVRARERRALAGLRAQLRRLRTDPAVRCRTRSILVIERATASNR
jgi:hypothetical protein